MSGQTRVLVEKRQRGFFGWLFLIVFIVFNLFMAYGFFAGLAGNASEYGRLTDDASRAGYAVGTSLGLGAILIVWVAGDMILGLFVLLTRGKKVIIERVQ
jgi:hypothetical protein